MKRNVAVLCALLLTAVMLTACSGGSSSNLGQNQNASQTTIAPQPEQQSIDNLPEGAKLLAWQGDVAWFLDITGLYGLIHRDGTILAKPSFRDIVYPFINGVAVVARTHTEKGYMNLKGELIAPMQYLEATPMSAEGVALAKKSNPEKEKSFLLPDYVVDVVSSSGQVLSSYSTNSSIVRPFLDGVGVIGINDASAINSKGEAFAFEYATLTRFAGGLGSGQKNYDGSFAIIDANGRMIEHPEWEDIRSNGEGMFAVKIGGQYGYVDAQGELIIQPAWDYAFPFADGMAIVEKNDLYGYIDRTGKVVIDVNWNYASDFNGGLAVVGNDVNGNSKPFFIIDKSGTVIKGPLSFGDMEVHQVTGFIGEYAIVRVRDANSTSSYTYSFRYGIINRMGELQFELSEWPISYYADGYYLCGQDVITAQGEVVGKGDYKELASDDYIRVWITNKD